MDETPADESPLEDRPPFLSWRGIYLLVLGALAVEMLLFALMSRVVR